MDALEDLGPLFATFDDALVHINRVADREFGQVFFRLQLVGDDGFEDFGLIELHTKQLFSSKSSIRKYQYKL